MRTIWPYTDGECWDQAFASHLVSGQLWPHSPITKRIRCDDPSWFARMLDDDGAVVVLHGEVTSRSGIASAFARHIRELPWALVIITSDECTTLRGEIFRGDNVAVWQCHPSPSSHVDRRMLIGYRSGTRTALELCSREPLVLRKLWGFGGQAQNVQRQLMAQAMAGRSDGDLLITEGFGQGRPQVEHLRALSQVAIALCPIGNQTPDCLRHYEALEAGCLPIADRNGIAYQSKDGFWVDALGREPFPCVSDWREAPRIVDSYAANPVQLQRDANRATAWWIGYKRETAKAFEATTTVLGQRASVQRFVPKRPPVTVLIPTSSIPAHPSTELIRECIARTRAYPEMADADVIIMFDGIHDNHAYRAAEYEEYKRQMIDLCSWSSELRGCLPLVFDAHSHQSGMTKRALQLVDTPLIFFQEHDTYPLHDIDWNGLFAAFEQPHNVNQIQLHIDGRILPEHRYLMIDNDPQQIGSVRLIRHRKWSQRPHLARTSWYRQLMAEYFGQNARTMIEDVINGALCTRVGGRIDTWKKWGTWIYHPDDPIHGILRSGTRDGRDGESKIPLVVEYDGETPKGAPHPGLKVW